MNKDLYLSPLRFAGGKSWLAPYVCSWLREIPHPVSRFVEPFAGGSSVGLAVADAKLATSVILSDLDVELGTLWNTIFYGDLNSLIQKIRRIGHDETKVLAVAISEPTELVDRALKLLVRNRISRSGILAPTSGFLKGGENGKGLLSRWYPDTIISRLRRLRALRGSVQFVQLDALDVVRGYRHDSNAVIFLDPPYSANGGPGSRLYSHHTIDDERLFAACKGSKAKVLLTYHDDPSIRRFARKHSFPIAKVGSFVKDNRERNEIILSTDHQWQPWKK